MISKCFAQFLVVAAALAISVPSPSQQASAGEGQPLYQMSLYNGHGFHIVYPAPFQRSEMPDGEGIRLSLDDNSGFIVELADSSDLAENSAKMRKILTASGWTLTADTETHNPIEGYATGAKGEERYVRVLWITGADRLWYILGYSARADAPAVKSLGYALFEYMRFDPPPAAPAQREATVTGPPAGQRSASPIKPPAVRPDAPPAVGCPGCAQAMSTYMNNMTKITAGGW